MRATLVILLGLTATCLEEEEQPLCSAWQPDLRTVDPERAVPCDDPVGLADESCSDPSCGVPDRCTGPRHRGKRGLYCIGIEQRAWLFDCECECPDHYRTCGWTCKPICRDSD